jgi:transposase
MRETDWTKVLGWPGYRVYRQEINERAKTLKLWVRRKRGNRKLVCSGCGRKLSEVYDTYEREVRDLPWSEFRTTVVVELYRVRCPDCGVKTEKVPQLPSKAPFSKRFEEAVGLACESAAVRRVAKQFGLSPSTVRAIDIRYLKRWAAGRRKPALRQMGVDEIYLGRKQKFLTVVSNLQTGEPLWFGRERKKETLDEFLGQQLSAFQRRVVQAACVDMSYKRGCQEKYFSPRVCAYASTSASSPNQRLSHCASRVSLSPFCPVPLQRILGFPGDRRPSFSEIHKPIPCCSQ